MGYRMKEHLDARIKYLGYPTYSFTICEPHDRQNLRSTELSIDGFQSSEKGRSGTTVLCDLPF